MKLDIDEFAEGAIILNGFEDCIVGVVSEYGNGNRILYSRNAIINKLITDDLMTESEADEYFDYNIIGGHFGDQNPVFLEYALTPVITINENKQEQYNYLINE